MNAVQQTRLALAIGAIALVLSISAAVRAGLRAMHLQAQITTATALENNPRIERALPQNFLVHAPSHGAAGAALLTRLRASARKAGVSLERAEPRPLDPGDPKSVKISAQASGSTRAIAAFLYELEARPPALLIERARLSSDEGSSVSVDILVAARAQYEKSAP
jgi:Type II secretion system (T2SS), protein M subtype b